MSLVLIRLYLIVGPLVSIYTFTLHVFVLPTLSLIVIVDVAIVVLNVFVNVEELQPLPLSLHATLMVRASFVQVVEAPIISSHFGSVLSIFLIDTCFTAEATPVLVFFTTTFTLVFELNVLEFDDW